VVKTIWFDLTPVLGSEWMCFSGGGVDVLIEDSAILPFPNASFDTVAIIAALNHIPNRNEVLLEVARVLDRNGCLILTMLPPVLSRVWHKLREPWDCDQTERGMKEGEVFGISSREMRVLLEDAGFSVVLRKRFMLGLNAVYVAKKRSSL